MQFDDRLATVLRSGAAGERAARTQFRQLLDLLGSAEPGDGAMREAAYARLDEICREVPATDQSRILREPGLRLRNPRLIAHLALAPPQTSAAAMAAARLPEEHWLRLIPALPVTARGFLRHRRDLPERVRQLLAQLGVRDLVLPQPADVPAASPAAADEPSASGGISELVRRIEAFQASRRGSAAVAPPLPLGEESAEPVLLSAFDFSTDASGTINWAEPQVAPLLVGLRLTAAPDGGAVCSPAAMTALRRKAPLRHVRVELSGADPVAGAWRMDATPRFDPASGAFLGHAGRMRRPLLAAVAPRPAGPADRMRQVLHELRTPVSAIQGFAEIIQQQLFGPAPNSYRALAGAIGVDAARLLAGFDEIDRLTRLETDALELSAEGSDLRSIVERTLRRLEGVTRPRSAHLRLLTSGDDFGVTLGESDSALVAWRLLATLAGALAPGEVVELALRSGGKRIELDAELPLSLANEHDLFGTLHGHETPAVTAGMFGTGFTLRLARAEAHAAGGSLTVAGERLVLSLPRLTPAAPRHSSDGIGGSSAAA